MDKNYYNLDDLKKFGNTVEFQKEMREKFFRYCDEVLEESSLSVREKSVIALAVAHAVQ